MSSTVSFVLPHLFRPFFLLVQCRVPFHSFCPTYSVRSFFSYNVEYRFIRSAPLIPSVLSSRTMSSTVSFVLPHLFRPFFLLVQCRVPFHSFCPTYSVRSFFSHNVEYRFIRSAQLIPSVLSSRTMSSTVSFVLPHLFRPFFLLVQCRVPFHSFCPTYSVRSFFSYNVEYRFIRSARLIPSVLSSRTMSSTVSFVLPHLFRPFFLLAQCRVPFHSFCPTYSVRSFFSYNVEYRFIRFAPLIPSVLSSRTMSSTVSFVLPHLFRPFFLLAQCRVPFHSFCPTYSVRSFFSYNVEYRFIRSAPLIPSVLSSRTMSSTVSFVMPHLFRPFFLLAQCRVPFHSFCPTYSVRSFFSYNVEYRFIRSAPLIPSVLSSRTMSSTVSFVLPHLFRPFFLLVQCRVPFHSFCPTYSVRSFFSYNVEYRFIRSVPLIPSVLSSRTMSSTVSFVLPHLFRPFFLLVQCRVPFHSFCPTYSVRSFYSYNVEYRFIRSAPLIPSVLSSRTMSSTVSFVLPHLFRPFFLLVQCRVPFHSFCPTYSVRSFFSYNVEYRFIRSAPLIPSVLSSRTMSSTVSFVLPHLFRPFFLLVQCRVPFHSFCPTYSVRSFFSYNVEYRFIRSAPLIPSVLSSRTMSSTVSFVLPHLFRPFFLLVQCRVPFHSFCPTYSVRSFFSYNVEYRFIRSAPLIPSVLSSRTMSSTVSFVLPHLFRPFFLLVQCRVPFHSFCPTYSVRSFYSYNVEYRFIRSAPLIPSVLSSRTMSSTVSFVLPHLFRPFFLLVQCRVPFHSFCPTYSVRSFFSYNVEYRFIRSAPLIPSVLSSRTMSSTVSFVLPHLFRPFFLLVQCRVPFHSFCPTYSVRSFFSYNVEYRFIRSAPLIPSVLSSRTMSSTVSFVLPHLFRPFFLLAQCRVPFHSFCPTYSVRSFFSYNVEYRFIRSAPLIPSVLSSRTMSSTVSFVLPDLFRPFFLLVQCRVPFHSFCPTYSVRSFFSYNVEYRFIRSVPLIPSVLSSRTMSSTVSFVLPHLFRPFFLLVQCRVPFHSFCPTYSVRSFYSYNVEYRFIRSAPLIPSVLSSRTMSSTVSFVLPHLFRPFFLLVQCRVPFHSFCPTYSVRSFFSYNVEYRFIRSAPLIPSVLSSRTMSSTVSFVLPHLFRPFFLLVQCRVPFHSFCPTYSVRSFFSYNVEYRFIRSAPLIPSVLSSRTMSSTVSFVLPHLFRPFFLLVQCRVPFHSFCPTYSVRSFFSYNVEYRFIRSAPLIPSVLSSRTMSSTVSFVLPHLFRPFFLLVQCRVPFHSFCPTYSVRSFYSYNVEYRFIRSAPLIPSVLSSRTMSSTVSFVLPHLFRPFFLLVQCRVPFHSFCPTYSVRSFFSYNVEYRFIRSAPLIPSVLSSRTMSSTVSFVLPHLFRPFFLLVQCRVPFHSFCPTYSVRSFFSYNVEYRFIRSAPLIPSVLFQMYIFKYFRTSDATSSSFGGSHM